MSYWKFFIMFSSACFFCGGCLGFMLGSEWREWFLKRQGRLKDTDRR